MIELVGSNRLVFALLSHLRDKPNVEEYVEPATVLDFLHRCAVSTDEAMRTMQKAMDEVLIEERKTGGIRLTVLGQSKIEAWRRSLRDG